MYAKLKNNKLIYAPKNYDTGDNLILNFNKNMNLMKKHGFKEVIDTKPEYNNATQYIVVGSYSEDDNTISINYVIKDLAIDETPTLEQRIAELEKMNQEQAQMIELLISLSDE